MMAQLRTEDSEDEIMDLLASIYRVSTGGTGCLAFSLLATLESVQTLSTSGSTTIRVAAIRLVVIF